MNSFRSYARLRFPSPSGAPIYGKDNHLGQHALPNASAATELVKMRKPFDVLAEGLLSENSRGDKTAIELFLAGVREHQALFQDLGKLPR